MALDRLRRQYRVAARRTPDQVRRVKHERDVASSEECATRIAEFTTKGDVLIDCGGRCSRKAQL